MQPKALPLHIPAAVGDNYWLTGDYVSIKLTAEQTGNTCAVAALAERPGHGPPPHVHHREAEMFYIVEQNYEFILDDTVYRVSPGNLIYLPPHRTHGFRNASHKPSRAVVFALPSGFDRFVKLAGTPASDAVNPAPFGEPEIARLNQACSDCGLQMQFEHRATRQVDAPAPPPPQFAFGQQFTRLLSGEQTGNTLIGFNITAPVATGLPLYSNDAADEFFLVVSGACICTLGDRSVTAEPGDMLYIPAGVARRITSAGPDPARLFNAHFGGRFESFLQAATVDTRSPSTRWTVVERPPSWRH